MKERNINVLGKLLVLAVVFGMLTPLIANAQRSNEARIEKLESEIKALKAGRPLAELGPSDLRVFWKEGLRFETADKDFSLKLGGRIYNDWGLMNGDSDVESSVGDLEDGTEFRTARLYAAGTIYGNVDYKIQFDFAKTTNEFKDVYLGIRDFPIGYLKMGHFKEPFGLEEQTSSRFITFMERSLANTFAPGRNTGFMLSSTAYDKRATWAAGIFRNTGTWGEDSTEGGYNLTGRVTALPWYEDKGNRLFHVGAAYSFRNPEDTVQYATEPEAHLAPDFVDTTALTSNRAGVLGLESALVYGPFSLQAEYMFADVDDSSSSSDLSFDGFYIQASYFLTGEQRNYKTSTGAFDRVRPKENYHYGAGRGAWEVAARYSQIDLNDDSVSGGELKDLTLGLNWYLNPNMRMMWNYIRSHLDDVGDSDLLLMRLQIDF